MIILDKKRRKMYDIKQATEILQKFGISHNEKKTRDLILKGKLEAKHKGNNPDDRRAGKQVSEKALYDLVTTEIPIMSEMFAALQEQKDKPKEKAQTK